MLPDLAAYLVILELLTPLGPFVVPYHFTGEKNCKIAAEMAATLIQNGRVLCKNKETGAIVSEWIR